VPGGKAMMSAMGISQQPWSVVREINHCSDQPNQRSQEPQISTSPLSADENESTPNKIYQ